MSKTLDEIIENLRYEIEDEHGSYIFTSQGKRQAKQAIQDLMAEEVKKARIDELSDFHNKLVMEEMFKTLEHAKQRLAELKEGE